MNGGNHAIPLVIIAIGGSPWLPFSLAWFVLKLNKKIKKKIKTEDEDKMKNEKGRKREGEEER